MQINPENKSTGLAEAKATFLIYVSIAAHAFTADELAELLKVSRRNNSSDGITGMLLYKEGKFMQLLEGEEQAVARRFEVVRADPRHRHVIVLLRGPQPKRNFSDFSMGFQNLEDETVRALPGYSDYMNTPLTADGFSADPSHAQRFLRIFKRTGLSL